MQAQYSNWSSPYIPRVCASCYSLIGGSRWWYSFLYQRFHSICSLECVCVQAEWTETQLQHGGFRSIASRLFIVGFPALCLALLSTQTCRCCNYLKPHKTSPSTIGVCYYLTCTRGQARTRHCLPHADARLACTKPGVHTLHNQLEGLYRIDGQVVSPN